MKKKPGPAPKDIDWDAVRKLSAMQCTRDEICSFFNMSKNTLDKGCRREFKMMIGEKMEEWAEGGKCSIRRKQWNLADKNAAMAIFLGKQYLGQKDDYNFRHQEVSFSVVQYDANAKKPWKEADKVIPIDG